MIVFAFFCSILLRKLTILTKLSISNFYWMVNFDFRSTKINLWFYNFGRKDWKVLKSYLFDFFVLYTVEKTHNIFFRSTKINLWLSNFGRKVLKSCIFHFFVLYTFEETDSFDQTFDFQVLLDGQLFFQIHENQSLNL